MVRMPLGRDLIQVWAVAAVHAVAWGHRGNAKRGGQRERVTEDAPPDEPRRRGLSGARGETCGRSLVQRLKTYPAYEGLDLGSTVPRQSRDTCSASAASPRHRRPSAAWRF